LNMVMKEVSFGSERGRRSIAFWSLFYERFAYPTIPLKTFVFIGAAIT
jgi:hypothetical protein